MLNFVFNKTEFEESHQSDYMGYREEPIECVKDIVLPIHKQIYAEFDGADSRFDVRIESTILRGSDRCTFRITRRAGIEAKV